ncbi:MAG: molybdate ABC transporter substrate-binding protein [Candidatus Limnocylindrales bacterium]
MRTRFAASIAVLALVLAGCSSSATPVPSVPASTTAPASKAPATAASATAAPANLTIYGASSLTAVLAKVKTTYEAANPGTTLTISTDSSTALETKIEQGAPADVFLSADTANPQKLVDDGYGVGPVTKFAGNLLTIIVPLGNPAGIETPADLAKSGVKIVTCGPTVPIAKYAAQLVANLATQPGYPADFVAKYNANVVSQQDNVSAVVSQIALGDGDAGIVYATDAKTSTQVTTVAIPAAANVPATYGGVVVKASTNLAAAQAFLTWLAGPDGQAVLASFGFLPAP